MERDALTLGTGTATQLRASEHGYLSKALVVTEHGAESGHEHLIEAVKGAPTDAGIVNGTEVEPKRLKRLSSGDDGLRGIGRFHAYRICLLG
jgi:hypothetical protein